MYMTNLITKINKQIKDDRGSIQILINKYVSVLELTKIERDIPYLAYIIDTSVNHINEKHKDLPQDWKTWSVLLITNKYYRNKIKSIESISKTIDEFISYWKSNYNDYCENIISATEYDRDRGFVYRFLLK